MSKKAILTCGYFSLNSANEELYKRGYDIIKMRTLANPQLDSFCIDDSKKVEECTERERMKYLYSSRGNIEEDSVTLMKGEMQAISLLGAGGRCYVNDKILSYIIGTKFVSCMVNINGTYDYLVEAAKRYNIKAILIHTAEGANWGALVWAAKGLGIPTFCCYNGTIVKYITEYTAHNFFNNADYYYLHGQYDVDWLESRVNSQYDPSTMPIVGQPSFDIYYNKNGKIKRSRKKSCNVFLYSSTTVFNTFDVPSMNLHITLDMIDCAFHRDYIPSELDTLFIRAFNIYQKKVNPNAELIITLRPYHNTTSELYLTDIVDLGIKNVKVFDHTTRPFRDLVKDVKYIVSGTSTILIESLLNRKAALCLTGNSDRVPFKFIRDWASIAKTQNVSDIVEGLINMTKNEEGLVHDCNKYAPYYNYGDDGKAGERLAEDLHRRIS